MRADVQRIFKKTPADKQVMMFSATLPDETKDVRVILDMYLLEHEESPYLQKIGDKYGRIIDGWNAEAEAPNIVYSFTGFPRWRKHNLKITIR